jgi:hypothetical protein
MKSILVALLIASSCKDEAPAQQHVAKAQEAAAEAMKEAMKAAEAAKLQAGEAAEQAKKDAMDAAKEGASPEALGEAMAKMQEAMGKVQGNIEPVEYAKLKAALPEKAGGFERKSASGEKANAMGFKVSHAEAKYEGKGGTARIKITDAGSMPQMGMAAFAMVQVERESDEGYEKTFTFKGHKGHEKYTNASKHGEIHAFIGNRFIVEVQGEGEMKDIKALFEAMDVDGLDRIKGEGAPTN